MTRLVSGRVLKTPSANVSAERYQFLEISEAEPDLGLPSELGQVFTSDLSGNRYWVRLDTANVAERTNLYFTDTRVLNALVGANVSLNNLIVSGDLEVQGNLVTLNVVSVAIEDKNLLLANGAINSSQADGAGITIAGANAEIKYFDAGDLIDINKNLNVQGNISLTGNILSNTGSILFVPNSSGDGNGYSTIQLIPDNTVYGPDQYLIIDPTIGPPAGHIHIRAGGEQDNSSANLYLGGENSHVEISAGPNPPVIIRANGHTTQFATDGTTYFPSHVNVQGNVVIDGVFVGNGLIIRNIAVTDEILTGNILGQGFTSNTVVVSETLTANVINANVILSKEWINLYTSNVIESPTNLYYTNDRVFSFVTGMSIGDLVDVANIYTHNTNGLIGIQEGQALVWDGNVFIPVFVNSEVANIADLAVRVLSIENFTTANIREASSNLYFTNTRVLDAISLATISPSEIYVGNIITNTITANIWNNLYTSNIIELDNLFYTNSRVVSAVTPLLTTSNVVEGTNQYFTNVRTLQAVEPLLTTSNVVEGTNQYFTNVRTLQAVEPLLTTANVLELSSNLYFTTQRARESVSNSTGVYYDPATGVFSIGQDVAITSDVQFRDLTLLGNLFILGNVAYIAANTLQINDPLIQVGLGNPGDQWDLGLIGHYLDAGQRHAGLFRDATDRKFKFFSNTTVEPGNVNYIDTAEDSFRLAAVVAETFEGNVLGTVSSLANHTTSNLAEGTNQYFTNVRVLQAVNPKLTTANVTELDNLYYTNARVLANVELMSINVFADVDITGVAVNSTLTWDGTKFIPGSTEASLRANFANTAGVANVALQANIANTVLSLEGLTTNDLNEGNVNLYFSNTRARQAFTAGRGIIIQENGLIKSTDDSDLYNLAINGSVPYTVTNSMATAITFPTVPSQDRFILRSLHVTNISETDVFISGNILYASGNTAFIADMMPIPLGGTLEFLKKTQVMQPGDKINLQSFNNTRTPANNIISSIFTYETLSNEEDFFGGGLTLNAGNVNTLVYTSDQSYTILESIKLVNLEDYVIRAKVFWADANGTPKAYFSYNIPLPPNSSVELLQAPKRIEFTDKIYVNYIANSQLSAFVSGRTGTVFTLEDFTGNSEPGSNITVSFSTTESEGTVVYYSIE